MQNTQVISNEEIKDALSSNEEIKDAWALTRKLVKDMEILVKIERVKDNRLSQDEINRHLSDKRSQLVANFMENKEEILERTDQILGFR